MAKSFDDLREQLADLQAAAEREEQRREELSRANAELAEANEHKAEELSRLQATIDEMKGLLPQGIDDAVLTLDVGGRRFKMYRSTLGLCGESVLATLVSPRWAEHARQEDGALFLDADPDLFQEIAYFLRRRRVDPEARSVFSCDAAELAAYLGVPVDHVEGSRRQVISFEPHDKACCDGLAFGLKLPHPAQGRVTSFKFTAHPLFNPAGPPTCSVFGKPGTYLGALAAREGWTLLWEGPIEDGDNRVPVDVQLRNGEEHAVYIACTNAWVVCSGTAPPPQETVMERTPGRIVPRLFQWPPAGDASHLEHEDFYFAGELVLVLHAQ